MCYAPNTVEWRAKRARKRWRDRQIGLLNQQVEEAFQSEEGVFGENFRSTINALVYLRQQELFLAAQSRGISIPTEYLSTQAFGDALATLNPDGEAWLGHELRSRRRAEIKDWIAIVMPILSLLLSSAIAILGLIVALKKK